MFDKYENKSCFNYEWMSYAIITFFYEPETVTASYNQDEIDNFLSTIQNEKSKKKTHYDLKIVKRFLYRKGESRDIEDIPPADLSPILCHFFHVTKKNLTTTMSHPPFDQYFQALNDI